MNEKRLRNIWNCMIGRCHRENVNNYFARTYYKEKGIVVCDEWRYSFETFKAWAMENGYEDTLSIDRIDSDGNYEPSNCRWIPLDENRRRGLEKGRTTPRRKKLKESKENKKEVKKEVIKEAPTRLTTKEKILIEKICLHIKYAPKEEKEYMLGVMEGMALMKAAMQTDEPKNTEAN